MCLKLIKERIPNSEKYMCEDFLKKILKSPDKLKQLCIAVLEMCIPNYSEDLVKSLMHTEEIQSPDKLKQLCLQRLHILLLGYNDAEFETIFKNRKINSVQGIDYPSSTNIMQYLQKLSLTHKSCVLIPRMKKEIVQLWTKTHWTQLDPYSNIEETGSEIYVIDEKPSGVFFEVKGGHCLHPRK